MKHPLFYYQRFSLMSLMYNIIVISMCSVVIALIFMLITSQAYALDIYLQYLAISESMGLCIGIPCCFLFSLLKPEGTMAQMVLLTLCIIGGSVLGGYISGPLLGKSYSLMHGLIPFPTLLTGIILGFIISFGFAVRERFHAINLEIREEKLARISVEKEKIQTDLKLLQAQVEPHFLFNTLSNILSLLDHDVATGKKMIENLTAYLRTSLEQSRKEKNRIKEEIEMIQSYLDIFKIRMGDRLDYTINFADETLDLFIPAMMIQPLVENAVKHGLEPRIDGGHITLCGTVKQDRLVIEVSDTGAGIQKNCGTGVGTGNIKKRLKAIYGDDAVLKFEEMAPSGLKATMEIPYVRDHSTDRR